MAKPRWLAPVAATFGVAAFLLASSDVEARGFGGVRGGGGFHGHVGRPGFVGTARGFGHGSGFHRHGGHHRWNGRSFARGGVPWAIGNGYGPVGYDEPRTRREPTYGIPPSPVLPPAIYVIGPKSGAASHSSGPAVRKGRANPVLTSGPAPVAGGSSASVIERRHRMN